MLSLAENLSPASTAGTSCLRFPDHMSSGLGQEPLLLGVSCLVV